MTLIPRKLYQIVGIVCGFALINYGFNFIAIGLPGAREMTSQFIGANMLIGGSAAIFISLLFLLRSGQPSVQKPQAERGAAPEIRIETIVEEQTLPQFRFYKNIEHLGYFLTAIGLFAASDLILQVFVRQMYNEVRWWVEILLVVFGILSFAIFVSLGRIGAEEERALITAQSGVTFSVTNSQVDNVAPIAEPTDQVPETIELRMEQFSPSSSEEYEHKLTDYVYDLVSIRPEMVNVWRENRLGMRSVYLAGPYELSSEFLEEHAKTSEPIRIGILSLSGESIQTLLSMQKELQTPIRS